MSCMQHARAASQAVADVVSAVAGGIISVVSQANAAATNAAADAEWPAGMRRRMQSQHDRGPF